MKAYNIRDAIFEAMLHRFAIDPTMVAFGEENRDWGGAFAVYRGLTEALPYHRLFNAPISEAGIVGAAVGYALEGGRVVAELMYADFMGRAGDEIFNQLSKWQAMSAGQLNMPVVLRISVGAKYGAQHSQDWTALVHHIPGLKVVYPGDPVRRQGHDERRAGRHATRWSSSRARRSTISARCSWKTAFRRATTKSSWREPSVKRKGKDLTIVTLGPALYTAVSRGGRPGSAIRSLGRGRRPALGQPAELRRRSSESVRKTGKVLLVSDAVERGSVMQTVAANLTQLCFDDLDAPPVVVGSRNWITPAAELEALFFPQPAWLLDAIHERILPLKGHRPTTNQTLGEINRRARQGV